MAFFDASTGQLVLHLVYDGAPYSGKTASVESLGRLLDRPVVSPQTHQGRTAFFDWMEYQGGVRYGRPITCRVISVPGQADLSHRRIRLLRSADAIIFVADSQPEAFHQTLEHWVSLHMLIDRWKLSTALMVQLNKRDLANPMPAEEMLDRLGPERIGKHLETEAIHDKGTRETFVLAAGEALRLINAQGGLRKHLTDTQPVRLLSPDQLAEILGAEDQQHG